MSISMPAKSLLSGLLGAVAVTILNESVRRVYYKAPRLEKLGIDAAEKSLDAVGVKKPSEESLYWGTMAADIVSNALYYSIISLASRHKTGRWMLGTGVGLAAGLGAVMLPEPLNLDASTTNRSSKTKALTVAWYLGGALLTTTLVSLLSGKKKE
jgi:hypothetical protein